MAESFRCSPETVTALLLGSTPVPNKKLKKKKESEPAVTTKDKKTIPFNRMVPGFRAKY